MHVAELMLLGHARSWWLSWVFSILEVVTIKEANDMILLMSLLFLLFAGDLHVKQLMPVVGRSRVILGQNKTLLYFSASCFDFDRSDGQSDYVLRRLRQIELALVSVAELYFSRQVCLTIVKRFDKNIQNTVRFMVKHSWSLVPRLLHVEEMERLHLTEFLTWNLTFQAVITQLEFSRREGPDW